MRLLYIFLGLVLLAFGWQTCIEAKRSSSSGSKQKTSTRSGHSITNQIGRRNNVSSRSSTHSKNTNTRIGYKSPNSSSTITKKTNVPSRTITKTTNVPSRTSNQVNNNNANKNGNHSHTNSPRVNLPNRGNSAQINQGRLNNTRTSPPNRSSPPPSRNSAQNNQGRTNTTRISPPNRGSNPPVRNITTTINKPNTTHPNLTPTRHTNTTIIQKKVAPTNHGGSPNHGSTPPARNITTTINKSNTTHPNLTPTRHTNTTIIQKKVAPPNHVAAPINSNTNKPNASPPVNTTSIQNQPPTKQEPSLTEAFLEGLQKGLSKANTTAPKTKPTIKPVIKKKVTIVQKTPTSTKAPPTTTKATLTAIPLPPYPSTPLAPFAPLVLYLPGGPYGFYVCNDTGQNPQGFVNGQTANTGPYVQPGYVQYPSAGNQQIVGNAQTATNGVYVPQSIGQPGIMIQGQTSQTPQGFNYSQPGVPVSPVPFGFMNVTQGQVHTNQTSVYTNPQNNVNGSLPATNASSYIANQPGFGQQFYPGSYVQPTQFGAPGSQFQPSNISPNYQAAPTNYFLPGQPGTPVSSPQSSPISATPQGYVNGLPMAPGVPQPYVYGPQGQICSFVYNPPAVGVIPPGFVQPPYTAQPGAYGVPPTGTNISFNTNGQYLSYPVWPTSAYPNVQPSTFNASQSV